MSEQERLNPADLELEAALKSLSPQRVAVDPVAAAFTAGQRSCQRQVRVWQAAAAASLLMGSGLWLLPAGQGTVIATHDVPGSVVAEHIEPMPLRGPLDQSLFMLQAAVAERGLDALPRADLGPNKSTLSDESIGLWRQP